MSPGQRARQERIDAATKMVIERHGQVDEVLPSFFGGDLIVDVRKGSEWIARYLCPADNIDVAISREA